MFISSARLCLYVFLWLVFSATARPEAAPAAAAPHNTSDILPNSSPATFKEAILRSDVGATLAKNNLCLVCGVKAYFENTPAVTTDTVVAVKYDVDAASDIIGLVVSSILMFTDSRFVKCSYMILFLGVQ
jgi:hypothetical protein